MFPSYLSHISNTKQDKYIDFLFIDGDHSYNGAKNDFVNYGKLVKPGGLIALHDIHVEHVEVKYLWNEIYMAGYKIRNISTNPPEMGIGIIYV